VLDAFSAYSVGVEFFAPFSQERYRFVSHPLRDYQNAGVLGALLDELFRVFLPACGLTLAGWYLRRTTTPLRKELPDKSSPPGGAENLTPKFLASQIETRLSSSGRGVRHFVIFHTK
jgi:hypothetical protein